MALRASISLVLWKFCARWIRRCRRIIVEPLFVYTIFWTTFLAAVVTVASVSPELAFTSTLSSMACDGLRKNSLRVPLDKPGDMLCLPSHLFKKSGIDFIIPPIFAALVVGASACFVHAIGIWEI